MVVTTASGGGDACLLYGIDQEVGSLSSCAAATSGTDDQQPPSFLVSTRSVRQPNQICRLDVASNWSAITAVRWNLNLAATEPCHLAAHPTKPNLAALCTRSLNSTDGDARLCLVKLVEGQREVEIVSKSEQQHQHPFIRFEWEKSEDESVISASGVAASGAGAVARIDMGESSIKVNASLPAPTAADGGGVLSALAVSPHHDGRLCAFTLGAAVKLWDTREKSAQLTVPEAHTHRTLALDFNPSLPSILATGGADAAVRIWDTRKTDAPLQTRREHAHWVYQVRFNPVHDQLLLSSGADARVLLHGVRSVSSEAKNEEDEDEESGETSEPPLADGLLDHWEEADDSVLGLVWTNADPWTFAALSYDGRVCVARLRRQLKYAVLRL